MGTRTFQLADRNRGLNNQISTLLNFLSLTPIDLPDEVYWWFSTVPFCNCREQGFVISLHTATDQINFCFYEHRNSDSIINHTWEGLLPISGVVKAEDIPNWTDKFQYTKSWGYLNIQEVREFLVEEIEKFVAKVLEKKKSDLNKSATTQS